MAEMVDETKRIQINILTNVYNKEVFLLFLEYASIFLYMFFLGSTTLGKTAHQYTISM